MKKSIKKFILLISILIILILIGAIIFLRIYLPILRYQEAFPNQPKIKDIAAPEDIFPLNLNDIYSYYTDGDNIYYLTKDKILSSYNIKTGQFSGFNWTLNIIPESIQDIKWLSKSKMLVFYVDPEFYEEEIDEDLPTLLTSDIKKIYVDLTNDKKFDLDDNTIDAFFDKSNNRIYTIESAEFETPAVYQINLNNYSKNHVADLNQGEIISTNTQNNLIGNKLYYLKGTSEISLYNYNLSTHREELIIKNISGANISPQENFILINDTEDSKIRSSIFNLQTQTIDYTFPMTILITRATWDQSGDNLYYVMGENLKMGDEQKLLNRRPSYVFFKYQASTKKNAQLNNHIYADPIDPQNLILDTASSRLYFIDIYMLQNSIYYLNLN